MGEEVFISDYDYLLPEGQIAQVAAEPRDSSKLLVYQHAEIRDAVFSELPHFLSDKSRLFFNDAKVIPARIFLKNSNDARIEVFLLQPHETEYFQALNAQKSSRWSCLIGNKKKWKNGEVLNLMVDGIALQVHLLEDQVVEFTWESEMPFVELLEKIGQLPLPPYIKHEANQHDSARYQTVYSKVQGSVAAPTAGLHFTPEVLSKLSEKGIDQKFVTLHVSAGTFLPVKVENARAHDMHQEIFAVKRSEIESLMEDKQIIAVGTTSTRVLESLFWAGVNILESKIQPFQIEQFAYENRSKVQKNEALNAILNYMDAHKLDTVYGKTSIMIIPSYEFRLVEGLVTNFHQPKSTLLLLISALLGDEWKRVYAHALRGGYRFLSYGDSSLLIP